MRPQRLLALVATAAATAALLSAVSPAHAGSNDGRTVLRDTAPSGPAAEALTHGTTTAAAADRRLTFQVHLRLRDEVAAEHLATAVSTPGNALYGHYLNSAAFDRRFAPTVAQAEAVEDFLTSYGIAIGSMPPNRRFVEASGTVRQVSKAFSVGMRVYASGTRHYLTDDRAVSVPTPLARTVLTVTGLNESGRAVPGSVRRLGTGSASVGARAAETDGTTPCSHYWAEHSVDMPFVYGRDSFPTYICGYTPGQLQSAYGMRSEIVKGNDGTGVRVAIVDAYRLPTMEVDANRFFRHYGERGFSDGQFTEVLPRSFRYQGPCQEQSWQYEEALDVESVHALAPGADVTYVAARSCTYHDLLVPLNTIVDGHLADIISNSWGMLYNESDVPTSWVEAYHAVLVQAAAVGIGNYFCDLDNGDTSGQTGSAEPVFPASDPFVTGIGGTSLGIDQNGEYELETGWGTAITKVTVDDQGHPTGYNPPPPGWFVYGSGGGVSTLFHQPQYQKDAVPWSLSHLYGGPAMRVEPDVSADADPSTGYKIGLTDPSSKEWVRFEYGGTSLATPLVAAIVADASTGRRVPVGFFNPLLYDIASKSTIHDVVPTRTPVAVALRSRVGYCRSTCLLTSDRDTSLTTTYGYDDVTGLGTPDGGSFVHAVESGG